MMKLLSAVAIAAAFFAPTCDAHGRLLFPVSRVGHTSYENDPVQPVGNAAAVVASENFVCRHAAAKGKSTTVQLAAGGTTTLKWGFTANHVGDCALFISYDVSLDRKDQKFFKIANFPECNKDNNQDVSVNLPAWLPAGNVVVRWDWYALHVYPGNVEFYVQCYDAKVSSSSTLAPSSIPSYSIVKPPVYGLKFARSGGDYRFAFGGPWFMSGPKCVGGVTGNCCDERVFDVATAPQVYTQGDGFRKSPCSTTGSSGSAPTGAGGGGSGNNGGGGSVVPETDAPTDPPVAMPVSPAPCDDGSEGSCKGQCQAKCNLLSGGVKVNQCWGAPQRYVECKCQDGSTHAFAGCECQHGNCKLPSSPSQPKTDPPTDPPPSNNNGNNNNNNNGSADYTLRCGSSWTDASSRCGATCPNGVNDDCPSGEQCFAHMDTTVCKSNSKPAPTSPNRPAAVLDGPKLKVLTDTIKDLREQAKRLLEMADALQSTLATTGAQLLSAQL